MNAWQVVPRRHCWDFDNAYECASFYIPRLDGYRQCWWDPEAQRVQERECRAPAQQRGRSVPWQRDAWRHLCV